VPNTAAAPKAQRTGQTVLSAPQPWPAPGLQCARQPGDPSGAARRAPDQRTAGRTDGDARQQRAAAARRQQQQNAGAQHSEMLTGIVGARGIHFPEVVDGRLECHGRSSLFAFSRS